jgi:NAD(P)-dependent dehydrogenase (short-subunit alcohol dehydrogenase family)
MSAGRGFASKTAVVVGSSGGWGRGVAIALAREGVSVVVNGTKPEAVASVVDEIRSTGGSACGCVAGVHTPDGAQQLTTYALEQLGGIDILVNSIGGKVSGSILEISPEDFDYSVDVQLKAPFLVTHLVAQAMVRSQTAGRIINMAGGSSVRPFYGESLHGATKGGILAATWVWALELKPYGITVNAVRGGVRTPGTAPLIAKIRSQLGDDGTPEKISDKELGFFEPEEAAALVVWLASESAGGVTGQFVGLDGPKVTLWGIPAIERELYDAQGWDVERFERVVKPLLEAATRKVEQESGVIDTMKHVGTA